MDTQNITLSLPRPLLKKVKVLAAKQESSVSGLLLAVLEEMVSRDDYYEVAMRRMLKRARRGYDLGTGGQIAVSREELHER